MTKLVADLPVATHAGLMVDGHRRKGDCNDIQALVPVSSLARKQMIAKLRKKFAGNI